MSYQGGFLHESTRSGEKMSLFDEVYEGWLSNQIAGEKNPRRRELLLKGIGHGTVAFLRSIWFPAIGNLDHLYPEYEVRDFGNGCRYLDLAYIPWGAKGCIEIHGYRTHARDIETARFKDLCIRRLMRPFTPRELSSHLRLSERHTRAILHNLVNKKWLAVASGDLRYRTYRLGQEPDVIF